MYKTDSQYDFEGFWAFSRDKSCWFSGILRYCPEEQKTELKIWGDGELSEIDYYKDTIIGNSTDSKKITLLNCILRSQRSTRSTEGDAKKKYSYIIEVGYILVGKHYENNDAIKSNILCLKFTNQFDFIDKTGLKISRVSDDIKIKFKKPEDIILCENDLIILKIFFIGVKSSSEDPKRKLSLLQEEYFEINFSDLKSFQELITEIQNLNYFLTFSISKMCYPIVCYFNDADSNFERVYLLKDSFRKTKSKYEDHPYHQSCLIDLKDTHSSPDLYLNWRKLCCKKESALHKYFSIIYNDNIFLDDRYYKFVSAFEDYHRCSPQYTQKRIIKNGKNKGNTKDVILLSRFENIFYVFQKCIFYLIEDKNEQDRIKNLLVDTRDFLVHGGDVKAHKHIKDPSSYFFLSDLLSSLIAMLILNDLGFSKEKIEEKMWKFPNYYGLVNYDWSKIS